MNHEDNQGNDSLRARGDMIHGETEGMILERQGA